jgi:hypothetical protein
MQTSVANLRAIATILFDHLEQQGIKQIEVDSDYYWFIGKEQLYEPGATPSDLSFGQLTDDIAELDQILSKKKPPIAYALVWFAAILRAVGEKVVR